MMVMILSLLLFLVFIVLGGFHFYWLFGGTWALENAIPTRENEKAMISIPKIATLLVALILTVFGLFYFMKSGLINVEAPFRGINFAYWFIPTIFILRSVGEFKYVGFFKKVKHTTFAKADSKLFSPLCLGIGVVGILILLLD
ncbi:DUF3995 domain-containing protein [Zobellia nedashkovskayae]